MGAVDVAGLDALLADSIEQLGGRLSALGAGDRNVTRREVIEDLAAILGHDWSLGPTRDAVQERQARLLSIGTFYGPSILQASDTDKTSSMVEVGWAVGRNNLGPLLLDVLGLLEAYQQPQFTAGYLVAAAPKARWTGRDRDWCTDWFAPEIGTAHRIDLANYLGFHPHGWADLRHELERRLQTLPGRIALQTIAIAPFRMRERSGGMKRCSVRCVRVTPLRDDPA